MKYARVENGVVVEIIAPPEGAKIEECFHPDFVAGLRRAGAKVDVGWIESEGELAAPPKGGTEAERERQFEAVRTMRTQLLASSDWTQMQDAPLDDKARAKWAAYRQELRDLPASAKDPLKVTWPKAPK